MLKIDSHEYICPQCKKQFCISFFINVKDYVYKRGSKFFCSWTCMRAYDRTLENKKKLKENEKYFYSLKSLGARLKFLRKISGIKLSTAALQSGVPESTLASYENNRIKNPMRENIKKLADFYGVKIKDLMGDGDEV